MKVTAKHECTMHKVRHEVYVPDQSNDLFQRWLRQECFIQDIPNMTVADREILLTGMCQEAWDSMFPEEECDMDCDGSSHEGKLCR